MFTHLAMRWGSTLGQVVTFLVFFLKIFHSSIICNLKFFKSPENPWKQISNLLYKDLLCTKIPSHIIFLIEYQIELKIQETSSVHNPRVPTPSCPLLLGGKKRIRTFIFSQLSQKLNHTA